MSNIRVTELDFDDIKSNLKAHFQGQTEFTDYHFEGSGLSALLDILAYNTHISAYLANQLMNESFLDSAVKRPSAVSLAKHNGYTPMSVRGAIANVNIKVINPSGLPSKLTLDDYTTFTSSINGKQYTFINTESHTASREVDEYNFIGVDIKEGSVQEFSYVVTDTTPRAKYEIPSLTADTSTLQVTVQKSATDLSKEVFTLSEDLTKLDRNSKIFFLEQNPMERFQIYFGDNILGKSPEVGNIVTLRYISSSGAQANMSNKVTQTFQASNSIGGSSNITITVNSNSTEGKDKENITSIKHYAPKFNAAKNRCVTASDFEALINSNYSGAESISVWGGEDNVPPVYGKVFVSLKPYEGFIISNTAKERIRSDILKNKQGVTVQVQFVDPEYLYVGIDVIVNYRHILTNKSSGQIMTEVINTIKTYFLDNLQQFDADYKHSSLIHSIISTDNSIDTVLASLTLQKRIIPILNSVNILNSSSAINMRNGIQPGTFESSHFYISLNGLQTLVQMTDMPDTNPPSDVGTGTIRLINVDNDSVVSMNIGTIDYSFGVININGITPIALPNGATDIRFTCSIQERNYNISTLRNEILILDDSVQSKAAGTREGLTVTVNSVA